MARRSICDRPGKTPALQAFMIRDAPMHANLLMGLLLVSQVSVSCRGSILKSCSPRCEGPSPNSEVGRCVGRYARPRLTPADIRRFNTQGRNDCFGRGGPQKLAEQGRCLPLPLGVDERNGKTVEVIYGCTDVCPDLGGIFVRYANIAPADCCALGGYPNPTPSRSGYHGCAPPEVTVYGQTAYYPRFPDRPWELGTRSPCDAAKIVFSDGTAVDEASLYTE